MINTVPLGQYTVYDSFSLTVVYSTLYMVEVRRKTQLFFLPFGDYRTHPFPHDFTLYY